MTDEELQVFLRCARQLVGTSYDIVRHVAIMPPAEIVDFLTNPRLYYLERLSLCCG